MKTNLHLFRRTKELEQKIDDFFDKLSEAAEVYRWAVRIYLQEGLNEKFKAGLDRVNAVESDADQLRRQIEKQSTGCQPFHWYRFPVPRQLWEPLSAYPSCKV